MKKKSLFLLALGFGATFFLNSCNQEAKEGAEELVAEEETVGVSGSFTVVTDMSTLDWKGKKVVGEHNGTVLVKSGSFTLDNNVLTAGNIVVDMTSISNTDIEDAEMNAKLVGHLKDKDFFATSEFPEATLNVTSASGNTVTADLTIKGQTHPVTFEAFVTEGVEGVEVSGTAKVDRTLYGIQYGSGQFFKDLGDKTIDDIFELTFHVVGK